MRKKSRVNTQEKEPEQKHQQQKPQQQKPNQQNKQKEQQFSLYLFLEVERNATPDQIKKQYRKLVLKYHPDKNQGDPNAREKFQKLKQAFDILCDPEKRKIYDETGKIGSEEDFDEKSFQSAYDYFRTIYKKVTEEDILDFEKNYRFGPMQEEDLLDYYDQNQGNVVKLIESIPLSKNQDIPRFIKFFQDHIKENTIQKFKSFDKTKGKVRLLEDEEWEFQQQEKQKKNASFNELALAIKSRNQNINNDFIKSLEEKYGGSKKTKPADKDKKPKPKKQKKV